MTQNKTFRNHSPTTKPRQSLEDLEKTLWQAADKLRSNMDATEYKHIVLGLIFLKYISDSFDELRQSLKLRFQDPQDEDYTEDATQREKELEDRDHYKAEIVFYVPTPARWYGNRATGQQGIQDKAKSPDIGKVIDDAIELYQTMTG